MASGAQWCLRTAHRPERSDLAWTYTPNYPRSTACSTPTTRRIFADTTWETKATYGHLESLMNWQAKNGGPEIVKVWQKNIELKRVPSYNEIGMYRRRCTMDWKIRPIHQYIRQRLGLKPGQLVRRYVRALLGISIDEADRMGPSRKYWEVRSYPLVTAQMSREDCAKALQRFGFLEVEGSACVFCPFQSAARWQTVRANLRTSTVPSSQRRESTALSTA